MNVFNMINGGGGSGSGLYVWKKYSDSTKSDFIGYVISDDSAKYPDGGEQDGFFYETVTGSVPLEYLRGTKVIKGSFTPSSDKQSNTVTHNLNIRAKVAFVWADGETGGTHGYDSYVTNAIFQYTTGSGEATSATCNNSSSATNGTSSTLTVNSVGLSVQSVSPSAWYKAGCKYNYVIIL